MDDHVPYSADIKTSYTEVTSASSLIDDDEPMKIARKSWELNRLYPISFGISLTKFIDLPWPSTYLNNVSLEALKHIKTREWAELIPGNKNTYVFDNEDSYRNG